MFWAPYCDYPPAEFVIADILYLAALLIAVACIRPLARRDFETLVHRLLLMWTVSMAAFAGRFGLIWFVGLLDFADRLYGLACAWLHTLLVPTALSLVGGIALQVLRLRRPPRLAPIISLIAFVFCLILLVHMVYGVLQRKYSDVFDVLDPSSFLMP